MPDDLTQYLFFVLIGTGAGAIIAAFGLGLVVTYQGSGLVNFGYGAMASWVGYVYADLRQGSYPFPIPGLPDRYHFGDDVGIWWAFALSLLTAAVMGVLVYQLVFRPLYRAPALAKVVASIGLVIVFTSLIERRFSDNAGLRVDAILPREPVTFMDGVTVPRDGLWLVFIVVLIAAAVWAASRYTRIGLAMRASAANEKGAILLGYSPQQLAQASFIVASLIGGLVVILASPMIQLSSGVFTFAYLIPALGAALIGGFRYVWPTVITGLLIGLVQSSFTKMQTDFRWFPDYGAREGLPFLVIIVAMVFLGERLPDRGSVETFKMPAIPPAKVTPLSVLLPVGFAIIGLLALGPGWRGAIMTTTIAMVLALSLVLLSGFGGQPSLAQLAFAGVAGFSLSKLAMQWDIPFPIAPILASLIAMAFGVVVGIPALRVRGTNLAIITLAGGVAISEFVFKDPRFVGDASTGGARVDNPKLGDWDLGLILGDQFSRPVFGILLVVVATLLALGVANIRKSPTGRRMLAARSNERAANASGVNIVRVKLEVFAASAFIAGVAGCMSAYRFGDVSAAAYGAVGSLTALAVAYLGGITCVSGAVTAGVTAASGISFYLLGTVTGVFGQWEVFIGGLLLILTAILNPEGIAGGIRQQAAAARAKKAEAEQQHQTPDEPEISPALAST
jgi:branched-chain amino acid transport system permease protein